MTRVNCALFAICSLFLFSIDVAMASSKHSHLVQNNSYICPMHPQVVKGQPGECPICGMDLVLQEPSMDHSNHEHTVNSQVYICPMHPQVVKDQAGECPICGMDLVLQEQPSSTDILKNSKSSQISVSGEMQQAMALVTEKVQQSAIKTKIKTYGTVQFDETGLSHIHTRAEGWIERLMVNTVGQRITKGDLLYEIYSPALLVAQEDFLSLLATAGDKKSLVERGR